FQMSLAVFGLRFQSIRLRLWLWGGGSYVIATAAVGAKAWLL
mgnify:CR=1